MTRPCRSRSRVEAGEGWRVRFMGLGRPQNIYNKLLITNRPRNKKQTSFQLPIFKFQIIFDFLVFRILLDRFFFCILELYREVSYIEDMAVRKKKVVVKVAEPVGPAVAEAMAGEDKLDPPEGEGFDWSFQ